MRGAPAVKAAMLPVRAVALTLGVALLVAPGCSNSEERPDADSPPAARVVSDMELARLDAKQACYLVGFRGYELTQGDAAPDDQRLLSDARRRANAAARRDAAWQPVAESVTRLAESVIETGKVDEVALADVVAACAPVQPVSTAVPTYPTSADS